MRKPKEDPFTSWARKVEATTPSYVSLEGLLTVGTGRSFLESRMMGLDKVIEEETNGEGEGERESPSGLGGIGGLGGSGNEKLKFEKISIEGDGGGVKRKSFNAGGKMESGLSRSLKESAPIWNLRERKG
jgi:hypothetical protein